MNKYRRRTKLDRDRRRVIVWAYPQDPETYEHIPDVEYRPMYLGSKGSRMRWDNPRYYRWERQFCPTRVWCPQTSLLMEKMDGGTGIKRRYRDCWRGHKWRTYRLDSWMAKHMGRVGLANSRR